jgi:hypothetical protein
MRNIRARIQRTTGLIAVILLTCVAAGSAGAIDKPDEQWIPQVPITENADSFQGLLIQENAQIAQKISWLACGGNGNDASKMRFCSSLDDEKNNDKTLAPGFDAILPQCVDGNDKNCIDGISAISADGKIIKGTYVRNFPETGNSDFAAAPERNFPAGKTPSLWKIPGVVNSSGTDLYLVRFTLRGTVMSSLDKNCPSCTNFKGYSAIISPVSIKKGNYARVEATDARNIDSAECEKSPSACQPGMTTRSVDETQNCAATEDGACALKEAFPAGYKFKLDVRLGASPTGWIHGRIKDPKVQLTKSGENTLLSVEGEPVVVPITALFKPADSLPSSLRSFYATKALQYQYQVLGKQVRVSMPEPDGESSFYEYDLWKDFVADKADASPAVWTYRSLTIPYAAAECFKDSSKFIGVVTTNAMMYAGGPPVFNAEEGTLEYKVGAPHLTSKGEVFKGTYDLQLSSEVARCLYKFTNAPIRASISIVNDSGEKSVATTVVNERDGWLRLAAYGFTFSTPTLKVKLSQGSKTSATSSKVKTISITCVKAKMVKKVTAFKPQCPKGFKTKK